MRELAGALMGIMCGTLMGIWSSFIVGDNSEIPSNLAFTVGNSLFAARCLRYLELLHHLF